jgi:hypothetical protein
MRSASDKRSRVIGTLALWAIVFTASFVIPLFVTPTGESFLRGFNRIVYWFWLQVAAFVVAIVLAISAQTWRKEISKRLLWTSRVPVILGRRDARHRRAHRLGNLLDATR